MNEEKNTNTNISNNTNINNQPVRNNENTNNNDMQTISSDNTYQQSLIQANLYTQQNQSIQVPPLGNNSTTQKINTESNKNTNQKTKNYKIIIIIILIIATIIITTLFYLKTKNNTQSNDIYNENIDTTNYEIAKIIFSEYYDSSFDENMIDNASYDTKEKEFKSKYISKIHNNTNKDSITIYTSDFITYYLTSVKYEYDKKNDMYVPHTFSSPYNGISNESKNKIINLAKEKGYDFKKNISETDYEAILKIIFENDEYNIQNMIKENNYELNNSSLTEDRIEFKYEDKNNPENYITIKSSMNNNIKLWDIFGTSDKALYHDSIYNTILNKYIIDYNITITSNLEQIQAIYNKTNNE